MTRERRDEGDRRLRVVLRAGDPAADDPSPPPDIAAGWRRAIRHATPDPVLAGPPPRWRFITMALAGLAIVMAISFWSLVHLPAPASPVAARPGAGGGLRTIRMTGPGGTRIIWSVNPDLPIAPSRTQTSHVGDRS